MKCWFMNIPKITLIFSINARPDYLYLYFSSSLRIRHTYVLDLNDEYLL